MPTPRWTASQLRNDLSARAHRLARTYGYLHDLSTGASPAVIFGRDDQDPARHGNFHSASYAAICANPDWLRRLAKPHTASRRSPARNDWRWMELDSASSSDALLMNIFCHPAVFDDARLARPVATLLNVDPASQPCFGARPGVPLRNPLKPRSKKAAPRQALDRTEIDLTLATPTSSLFLEAKLTESNFQAAAPSLITRYRDLEPVFDLNQLLRNCSPPRRVSVPAAPMPHPSQTDEWDTNSPHIPAPDLPDDAFLNLPNRPGRPRIAGYQLIRNVLAAYAADASFCVLCDARRGDLIDTWYAVLSTVRSLCFATRLKLLTWQELAAVLPTDLQSFLDEKYGIAP